MLLAQFAQTAPDRINGFSVRPEIRQLLFLITGATHISNPLPKLNLH